VLSKPYLYKFAVILNLRQHGGVSVLFALIQVESINLFQFNFYLFYLTLLQQNFSGLDSQKEETTCKQLNKIHFLQNLLIIHQYH
jgi:hypothetical protein